MVVSRHFQYIIHLTLIDLRINIICVLKRLSAPWDNLKVAGDLRPLCDVTANNSDETKVAIIDLLTERKLLELKTFDEIWYWKSELKEHPAHCRSIFDYKAESYWLWQKRAKELCEGQLTKTVEERLKGLYRKGKEDRLLHLRMQVCTGGGDILAASRIGQFVHDRQAEHVTFHYVNNELHYIDDIVKEKTEISRESKANRNWLGFFALFRAIVKLLLLVVTRRPILWRKEPRAVDVLFFLDHQVQQLQMSEIISAFRKKGKSLALVFHHPIFNDAKPSTDPQIHVIRRNDLLRATPWESFVDFIQFMFLGLKALFYALSDSEHLDFYEGAIRMNISRLCCQEVGQYFKARRAIITGEYSREFNVWTTTLQQAGFFTELIVHGAAKAIYRHSFLVIDRLYVWGTAQEAFSSLDSKVSQYVDLGPLYIHRVHSEALPKEEVTKKLIVVLSQHLDTLDKEDAGFDFKKSDRTFFQYVIEAAREIDDHTFLILPHPYEQKRGFVNAEMEDELRKQKNIEFSYDIYPFNTFRYIKHAALALTQNSASGYECLYSGGRCIFFDTEPGGYMSDYRSIFGNLITSPEEYSPRAWVDHLKEILSMTDDQFRKAFPFRRYGANELIDGITSDEGIKETCAE